MTGVRQSKRGWPDSCVLMTFAHGGAGESSTCTIFSSRTQKRSLEGGVTLTKEEFKVPAWRMNRP